MPPFANTADYVANVEGVGIPGTLLQPDSSRMHTVNKIHML